MRIIHPSSESGFQAVFDIGTVHGRNPANQLRLVVYPIIYMVLHIPGDAGMFHQL